MLPVDELNAHSLMNSNRGRAYLLLGRYAKAEAIGDKVLQAGHDLGQNSLIALGHRLKGAARNNLGDYELSKYSLVAGIAIADTLEALGEYKMVLECRKKHFSLEVASQLSVATARAELYDVEMRVISPLSKFFLSFDFLP